VIQGDAPIFLSKRSILGIQFPKAACFGPLNPFVASATNEAPSTEFEMGRDPVMGSNSFIVP